MTFRHFIAIVISSKIEHWILIIFFHNLINITAKTSPFNFFNLSFCCNIAKNCINLKYKKSSKMKILVNWRFFSEKRLFKIVRFPTSHTLAWRTNSVISGAKIISHFRHGHCAVSLFKFHIKARFESQEFDVCAARASPQLSSLA